MNSISRLPSCFSSDKHQLIFKKVYYAQQYPLTLSSSYTRINSSCCWNPQWEVLKNFLWPGIWMPYRHQKFTKFLVLIIYAKTDENWSRCTVGILFIYKWNKLSNKLNQHNGTRFKLSVIVRIDIRNTKHMWDIQNQNGVTVLYRDAHLKRLALWKTSLPP